MTHSASATHEVFNQSPPFEDVDLFAVDRPLAEAVAANGGVAAEKELSEFGQHWGSAAMAARGRVANENTPKLRTFDSRGNRRDEVEFHPAYHELMARSAHAGVHNSTWDADRRCLRSAPGREILHRRASRDRTSVPDHHDACVGGGIGGAA
jgi:putative acyl-CoA dehydrogenase